MDDPGGQLTGLAPINLADRNTFTPYFAQLPHPLSDYSFANTFIWSTSLKLYWMKAHRHLCVFANGTGDLTMLMPPLPDPGGAEDPTELRDCLEYCFQIMDRYNLQVAGDASRSRIEYVSDPMLEKLLGLGLGFTTLNLSTAPMSGDYVYDMARMIDLSGGPLKSKRHARSKFMRDYPNHHVAPLTREHLPACHQLLDLWREHGDQTHQGEMAEHQVGTDILRTRDTMACRLALEHHQALNLQGMVLMVGDQLVGFTLGESLTPNQASILIEKTHPDFHGAPQFIFSEFCRRYWNQYSQCNVGDDWGIPSLRFTKQSYRPTRLLLKYVLTRAAAPTMKPLMQPVLPTVASHAAAPTT